MLYYYFPKVLWNDFGIKNMTAGTMALALLTIGALICSFCLGTVVSTMWNGVSPASPAMLASTAPASAVAPAQFPAGKSATTGQRGQGQPASGKAESVTTAQAKFASPSDAASATSGQAAPPKPGYSLQFGTFLHPTEAQSLVAEMTKRGLPAIVGTSTDPSGRLWHYVRSGDYPNKQAAQAAAASSQEAGLSASVIYVATADAKS